MHLVFKKIEINLIQRTKLNGYDIFMTNKMKMHKAFNNSNISSR